MVFVLQLGGRAAGGRVDLGPWGALQLFVCGGPEDCGAYNAQSGCNAPRLSATMEEPTIAPPSSEVVAAGMKARRHPGQTLAAFAIELEAEDDDRLAECDEYGQSTYAVRVPGLASTRTATISEEEQEAALERALASKIGGVYPGAPPRVPICQECRAPMRFLALFPDRRVEILMNGVAILHACPSFHEVAYQSNR